MKLSVIIPVYYNEENLPVTYKRLVEVLDKQEDFTYEIIFVDDGSGDNSYQVITELAKEDKNVRGARLSRNFGSHAAILAGLSLADGDCATAISADLQDDPKIIVEMFEEWKKGHKVVLAVREDRKESWLQKGISNQYYHWLRKYALPGMPEGGFDCFLIDRQVIEVIKKMSEKNSTIMGQIVWAGFKTKQIKYVRQAREIGKSRWTLAKKIKLFVDSFLAFSYLPVRAMSMIGIIFFIMSIVFIGVVIINKIFNNISVQGWPSIIALILFTSGLQMLTLGIIGEYLWRALDESRKRPVFIIDEVISFDRK